MRNPILIAAVTAAVIAVVVLISRKSRMPTITQEELQQARKEEQDLLLLDVRSQGEFDSGHIPGARHIPHGSVIAEPQSVSSSTGERIVVYCQKGPRALLAQRALIKAGFTNVVHLAGDMSGWNARGLPTGK